MARKMAAAVIVEEVKEMVQSTYVCPKCLTNISSSVEKIKLKGEGVERIALKLTFGVHPHAQLYGIAPTEECNGSIWKCPKCEFEFYTKMVEE